MSTADSKPGHGAAWANLIVCGGISWAVSLWHATHAMKGGGAILAVLIATAPVVTAAFASHHVVKKGAKLGKRIMTCIVFAMGMALSIKAQAQSVGPFVGGIELGVVFALMLDVSTFLALSSIMSREPSAASADRPAKRPMDTPADTSRRVSAPVSTDASTDTRRTPPAERPRTPAKPAPRTRPVTAKSAVVDTRAKARELLKANPDMNGNELAAALKRKPAGSIRTMRGELLEELRDAGELPSVRALGA